MSKKQDKINIVSIDPYENSSYSFANNEIQIKNLAQPEKNKEIVASYIKYKDITTGLIEIPRNILEEDVPNTIAIKSYEEFDLDTTIDYKINYIESQAGNGENRVFNVFVVKTETIEKIFKEPVGHIQFIDYIAIAPLLMTSLYKKNLLSPNGVDCFIYLQKDDAFLAVYQNGEIFLTRSLNRYSLNFINEKFCELTGNRLNSEVFFKKLKDFGLEFENGIERAYINQIFDDMFFYLSDVINSFVKFYGLRFNTIYLGTDIGSIDGLDVFARERLDVKVQDLRFNIAINSKDFEVSQIHTMLILLLQDQLENDYNDFNFSIFLRPPPLLKRPSGKLLGVCVAAVVLTLIYPLFQYALGTYLGFSADSKQSELEIKTSEKNRIETELKKIEDQLNIVKENTKQESEKLDFRKSLLSQIHKKKVNYPMKSIALYDVFNYLNSKGVQAIAVANSDNNITIASRSANDKKITDLIQEISKSSAYSVATKEILLGKGNQKLYESNITVEIKQ